jgi:hypothetical protein
VALRNMFGWISVVGALAFIVHAIVFYLAFRSGAATPTAMQPHRIVSHSDAAYVNHLVGRLIFILEMIMLIGLGIGVSGGLASEALGRYLQRRSRAKAVR